MKNSDDSAATSSQKGGAPAQNESSEGWYQKLFYMLLGNILFSLLLIDRTLRLVPANRNALVKARRTEAPTVGGHISEVFPDAVLWFTQLEVKIHLVFDTGRPTRIYYYTVIPVKSGNLAEHAMLVMDDITEKVQLRVKARMAERYLVSVIESSNDLVVSTDAKGPIISGNAVAERISGFRVDAVRGRLMAELCDSVKQDVMTAIIARLLRFAWPTPSDQVEATNLVSFVQKTVSLQQQQMVMNLILNPYQAMPAGGQIKIAVRRKAAEAVDLARWIRAKASFTVPMIMISGNFTRTIASCRVNCAPSLSSPLSLNRFSMSSY